MVVFLTFAPLLQDYCKKNATFPIRPGKMEMLNQGPTVAPLQYGGPHAAGGYWGNPGTAVGAPRPVGGMPGSIAGLPGTIGGMPGTIGGMPVSIAGMPGTFGGMLGSVGGMPGTAPSALSSIYVNMEEGSQVTQPWVNFFVLEIYNFLKWKYFWWILFSMGNASAHISQTGCTSSSYLLHEKRINITAVVSTFLDPGCLYRIPDTNFSIPDPGSKRSRIRIRIR